MFYPIKPVILATDYMLYVFFFLLLISIARIRKNQNLAEKWQQIFKVKLYNSCFVLLIFFFVIALLDSIHFKLPLGENNGSITYKNNVNSVFDQIISPLGQDDEQSYSKPFATHNLNKSYFKNKNGDYESYYEPLKIVKDNPLSTAQMLYLCVINFLRIVIFSLGFIGIYSYRTKGTNSWSYHMKNSLMNLNKSVYGNIIFTTTLLLFFSSCLLVVSKYYHIFGTNKVGQDVLFQALKSIRTGIILGTITTLFSLPLAIIFGICSGYFGKVIDDIIQYIYTTISAIPGILLISAAILSLQVWLGKHATWFGSMEESSDVRLLMICVILGITGWTSLCRLLRGETLKLREMDFVTAAKTLGVSKPSILFKHILPNVMHIVLIVTVIDFSGLVLAEAVLSYIGVGVDPTTISWGNMINSARLELAREPAIWWSLTAAFIFMSTMVLAANIFADGVRDAFDPRERIK